MRVLRSHVSLLLAALTIGAVLWTLFSTRNVERDRPTVQSRPAPSPTSSWLGQTDPEPGSLDLNDDGATQVDFDPFAFGGAVHADAVDVPVPGQRSFPLVDEAESNPPPAALAPRADAHPIDERTADAERVLETLIDRELGDLTESQRRVWRDVLHGLSAQEAQEIMQIWKLTGRPQMQAAEPSWPSPRLTPDSNTTLTPPGPVAEATTSSAGTPELLRRENLRYSSVAGYRRRELVTHFNHADQAPESAQQTIRIDLSQAPLRKTGNPLHLAIEGAGFFALRKGSEVVCTRNGEFDLSDSRKLIQRRSDGDWLLEPPLQLPDNAVQVVIQSDGAVLVRLTSQLDQLQECGRIRLATTLNPQHLEPWRADLLSPTPRSGELVFLAAEGELGALRAGMLEQSNVSLDQDADWLERRPQSLGAEIRVGALPESGRATN